jgi:hypothetical protein
LIVLLNKKKNAHDKPVAKVNTLLARYWQANREKLCGGLISGHLIELIQTVTLKGGLR